MTSAVSSVLIVEELVDFLKDLGHAKSLTIQVELFLTDRKSSNNLDYYIGHLNTCIYFTALLANTLEVLEKDSPRSCEYFESLADINDDELIRYTPLEYLRIFTNDICEWFDIIHRAYKSEIEELRVSKALVEIIAFNLKEMKFYLWR